MGQNATRDKDIPVDQPQYQTQPNGPRPPSAERPPQKGRPPRSTYFQAATGADCRRIWTKAFPGMTMVEHDWITTGEIPPSIHRELFPDFTTPQQPPQPESSAGEAVTNQQGEEATDTAQPSDQAPVECACYANTNGGAPVGGTRHQRGFVEDIAFDSPVQGLDRCFCEMSRKFYVWRIWTMFAAVVFLPQLVVVTMPASMKLSLFHYQSWEFFSRGIQPHNGGAWRALIDEFTDKHFTWITRPLLRTTDAEGGRTFYDTHLQRKYTKAEAEQVQRELGEAEAQKQIRQKARQLLRYYRINERHPQKLIMNLAYDEHSVDALLEEARDRWGNTPEVGGSEEEDEEPTDVLQFWHEWGDCPLESPHLDWGDDEDDLDSAAGGGLVPVPIAKTGERRKATFAAEQTSFRGNRPGQAPTEGDKYNDEF
ncbi:Catsper1 [Symbiodinium microadriaticum]|nr:Catsper1 [Symbiodinium microadriaticum]